jgi:cysteinyl-tRNA synthetase
MIQLTNTLSGKKEIISISHNLLMYVCGVTPYDHAHIGHGRCYVAFDVVYRLLTFFGAKVMYCRNFTDIDDKLLYRAEKELGDRLRYREIADCYIKSFKKDMQALRCISPQHEPRVTDNISHIIAFIEQLIIAGHAYQSGGDVYFDIETFPAYGKLSKQKLQDLYAGVRIDVREQKKNPLDFVLWKSESHHDFWKSPWGYGRPGWHIECSALAKTYLGKHIDIHGGGLDLLFPHHENENAQSESLYEEPFAKIWAHNGFVTSNKEKMSKSLGNFFTLHELFKHFDPMVVRYYFLTHHYRAPIEFSFDLLKSAQKSYERLIRMFEDITQAQAYEHPLIADMLHCLKDDLNTPSFFGLLFENSAVIHDNKQLQASIKSIFVTILGLILEPLVKEEIIITADIQQLIEERKKARQEKNWKRSDELRDQLTALGIDVHDEKL